MIYDILNSACDIFAEPGTLIKKKSGTSLNVYLTPEDAASENIQSEYAGAIGTAVFSIDVKDLELDGATVYPEDGDIITARFGADREQRWKVIKDSNGGRAWNWKWNRPGDRIVIRAMKLSEKD